MQHYLEDSFHTQLLKQQLADLVHMSDTQHIALH